MTILKHITNKKARYAQNDYELKKFKCKRCNRSEISPKLFSKLNLNLTGAQPEPDQKFTNL